VITWPADGNRPGQLGCVAWHEYIRSTPYVCRLSPTVALSASSVDPTSPRYACMKGFKRRSG
jgi:hypothetical protein